MRISLEGKTAWITGAGSGIGRAAAIALGKAGARVALSGRRSEPLKETLAAVQCRDGEGIVVPINITDSDAVLAAAERIRVELGDIDILVNNAGINLPKRRYSEREIGDWHMVIDANLNGAYGGVGLLSRPPS